MLKGGGWYADLYGSAKPAAKSDDAAASGETKPARRDAGRDDAQPRPRPTVSGGKGDSPGKGPKKGGKGGKGAKAAA